MSEPLSRILDDVEEEVLRAEAKFASFHSAHEGYAVLAEEVDELWDAVKADDRAQARAEAMQVAAMAVRFLLDVPAAPPAPKPAGYVCPECPECRCAPPFHKGSCSKPDEQLVDPIAENARLTRELAAERELRRQDAARLVAAAENAGIPYGDCDTADDLAEALLCEKAAREKAEAAFAAMAAALRECHAHAHNYGLHLSAGHPMRTAQIQLINATSAKVRAALSPASGSALLARLGVVEKAETWREVREYMRTEALQLRLSGCGDVEALALAAMKWGTPLEAARLDVEAALAALKETP